MASPPTVVQTFSDGTIFYSDGTITRPNYPEEGQNTFDTVGVSDPTDTPPTGSGNIIVAPATGTLTSGEIVKSGNGTSAIVIFSDAMRSIGLSLFALAAGSAKVQYTYDTVSTIQNGNDSSINWFDWSLGTVIASAHLWDNCARAIRLYVITGSWRLDWKAVKT